MAAGLRFRIFGIPVHIDASFFVVAVLLGLGGGTVVVVVSWVVVVFVSVLLHEMGHAVAFRIYGQKPRITLQGMGGLTSGSGPLTGSSDIVVSLAGPLAGLVLLGVPAFLLQNPSGSAATWDLVLRELVFVNIAWSGVNLLPVLPLDGGQVAASLLRRFRGDDGQRIAYKVSIAVAAVAALLAYQLNYVFGSLFAVFFIAQNYNSLRSERLARQREPLVAGYQALSRNDLDGAVSAADGLLAMTPPPLPEVAAPAVELKAWARFCTGGASAAAPELEAMPPGVAVNGFLTGSMALEEGRTDDALDALAEAFGRSQSGPWSMIVAETVGRAGVVDRLVDRLLATPAVGSRRRCAPPVSPVRRRLVSRGGPGRPAGLRRRSRRACSRGLRRGLQLGPGGQARRRPRLAGTGCRRRPGRSILGRRRSRPGHNPRQRPLSVGRGPHDQLTFWSGSGSPSRLLRKPWA